MNPGGPPSLREVTDKHYAALLDELANHIDSQLQSACAQVTDAVTTDVTARVTEEVALAERANAEARVRQARETAIAETLAAVSQARGATAEALNQALRRIRKAPAEAPVLSTLLETTAPWAKYAVVLTVENDQARSIAVRGLDGADFSFALESAAALRSVCESLDPLVALISDNELSPALAEAIPPPNSGGKAYLFPVVARQEAVAVLIVAGDVAPTAVELLSEAAGMKIESLEGVAIASSAALRPLPSPELVQIVPAPVPESKNTLARSWSDLSSEDQKLHLQAQRVTRVKVAEMRLYHAEQLRKGVFEANIYATLGNEIDRARADFLKEFLSKSPTMVDYLHLELLRSLAHDDDRLLGPDYPGPMV
jgi:hypothetical protein